MILPVPTYLSKYSEKVVFLAWKQHMFNVARGLEVKMILFVIIWFHFPFICLIFLCLLLSVSFNSFPSQLSGPIDVCTTFRSAFKVSPLSGPLRPCPLLSTPHPTFRSTHGLRLCSCPPFHVCISLMWAPLIF